MSAKEATRAATGRLSDSILTYTTMLLYNVGRDLGFSNKDISMRFADMIRRHFTHSLDSIG